MAGKFESTEKKKRKKWPWILAICLLLIAADRKSTRLNSSH